jgi:hypothetical protein
MGEDCLDAAEEQSGDFAKAAAALQAAQMAALTLFGSIQSCITYFVTTCITCNKSSISVSLYSN